MLVVQVAHSDCLATFYFEIKSTSTLKVDSAGFNLVGVAGGKFHLQTPQPRPNFFMSKIQL